MDDVESKVAGYLSKAKKMFGDLRVQTPEEVNVEEVAKEFYVMASGYYRDALHFYGKKEYVNALAALEYAEGWVDAGKVVGIFKK